MKSLLNNYLIRSVDKEFILIEDLNNGISITNSASAVVKQLKHEVEEQGYDFQKLVILYRDSNGRYDVLAKNDCGEFDKFIAVGGSCPEKAKEFYRKQYLNK